MGFPVEVVILCGGRGMRLREFTDRIPKPMVTVGDRPVLWHVMQLFAAAGHDEFILCLGYKGEVVREYFTSRGEIQDFGADTSCRSSVVRTEEGWTVRMIDTGSGTMTGGRLKRVAGHIHGDTFLVTYADCLSDVNLPELIAFHAYRERSATMTVVKPPPRFGIVRLEGDRVATFAEKQRREEPWINGGFFVFDRALFHLLSGDEDVLEERPLRQLAATGQLSAFVHTGFWQCVDLAAEVAQLNALWGDGHRPWLRWATSPSTTQQAEGRP